MKAELFNSIVLLTVATRIKLTKLLMINHEAR